MGLETLVLVRHGATTWNENGYFQGRRDVPLSERGREQVSRLRPRLAALGFDAAYASPLARAVETARLLGHEPRILPDLSELDRGHWEGHPGEEIRRRWGKLWRAWYDDPTGLAMPGGEAFDSFWERAGRALEAIEGDGVACALICAHKAINRVLIARLLGRPPKGVWDLPQKQACWSVLHKASGGWRAEELGSVEHLPDELRSDS